MKYISKFLTAVLITFFFLSVNNFAQDNDGSYYTMTTFKINIPEDGSRAELMELMNEWTEKIVKENDHIVSERIMRHQSGADSRDMVILTEYKDWNGINAAADNQNELVNAAWADEEARKEFFGKFNKYFREHSDEIYVEVDGTRK